MQPRKVSPTLLCFCLLLLLTLGHDPATGEDRAPVQVTVDGGRTFSGQVDALTDEQSLVLRSGTERAWVRRTIEWSRIASGAHAGKPLTADELRAVAERVKTPPAELSAPPANREAAAGDDLPQPPYLVLAPPTISSIAVDATLANWDGDVEADGLIVHLQPIDLGGFYAPASGAVEIELFARRQRPTHHAPLSGGRSVELISRWTCAVTPADFGPGGAVLKFPFGAAHPEFTHGVGSYGLVHVRMSVPGSGVFEDSQDGVRIRPFAPLRDTLQLNAGTRFLPTERTGRGKGSFAGGR